MTQRGRGALLWGSPLFLLAVIGSAAEARAQTTPTNKVAADALYEQAKKLMAGGDFEAACPKLAESQRLDPGVGTQLTLGECYDHTGRKASAWVTFREAATLARTRGQLGREKIARSRAASLEPKLPKLVIAVPKESEAPGLVVARDGEPIGQPLWGTPVPIDGGEHTLLVSAPGRKPWTSKVRIDKDGQIATVSVPTLSPEDPAPTRRIEPPASARAGSGDGRGTQRALGFIAGGVGLAGIGAGVGLGLLASSRHADAQARCAPTCAAGGGDAIQQDAKRVALGSTIGFITGGALIVGGAAIVLTAPASRPGGSAVRVAPLVSGELCGAVISGRF